MQSIKELIFSFLGLLALIGLFLSSDVFAKPGPLGFGYAEIHEPMETDRPDFTEGTKTVQKGHLQIELGYGYTYDDDSDVKSHAIPQSLFRIGVHDLVELRFSLDGYQDIDEGASSRYGTSDLTIGTKFRVLEACSCDFEISGLVNLTVPTGSEDFSQDDVSSGGSILWAYGWESDFSLAGNLNFDVLVEDSDYYFEPSASLALAYSITEEIGSYVEYFGFYPRGGNAPSTNPEHFLNGGFTYALTDNVQLDVLAGFGVNDAADDFFTGCGLSIRI